VSVSAARGQKGAHAADVAAGPGPPVDERANPPVGPSPSRLLALIASGATLSATCWALARVPNLALAPRTFLAIFTVALLAYAGGAVAARGLRGQLTVIVVLAVAVIARLLLLPSEPSLSTDVYRYVWDARVAGAGMDPYAYAPIAPEVAVLRDATIYPRLNHPAWHTVYPPAAQAFFRAVYWLAPDSMTAMKRAFGVAELGALAAVVLLLGTLGLPAGRLVVYAWSPLLLVEIWGSGHLDALVLLGVTVAALASAHRRDALAAGALGLATLVKLYPAVLFLLLPGRRRPAVIVAFATAVVAGSLGADLGRWPVAAIGRYVQDEYFNPGLVRSFVNAPRLALLASLAWAIMVAWRGGGAHLAARAVPLVAGVIVLAPNVFPWYAVWLVPFLAVTPSVPLIAFTGAVGYAYSVFLSRPWGIPPWARLAEAVPVGVAIALGLRAAAARFRRGHAGASAA
jgi:alpha-1,6-mannosyltransferase